MHKTKRNLITGVVLIFCLLLSSCSAGDSGSSSVSSLEDVRGAVIQIVAQGTFVDPQVGKVINSAGSGTGFIIDPSGIAVTNNHVVTGAALLQVYVDGYDEPLNAKILGVSECSDLAVIDIDGEGFPALSWHEDDINTGLEVYAAGYPLGDPEYTLTKGIVSKEDTTGETPWSSVDHVIEHDATINPGNSGGPLVTESGKVVGVNYLKSAQSQFVAAQYFAIARSQALPLIEEMMTGADVNSIGVNGEAVNNGEGLSGIWVSSVKSGSPADEAGVQPGDIILTLEDLVLATDSTLADYCDILRTHEPGDVLDIQVMRFSTGEILTGQLNGRPLESVMSFLDVGSGSGEPAPTASGSSEQAPTEEAAVEEEPTPAPTIQGYPSNRMVRDDFDVLEVELPTAWSDIDGRAWAWDTRNIGVSIWAAPDMEEFTSGWNTPGMKLNVTMNPELAGNCSKAFSRYEGEVLDACQLYDSNVFDQAGLRIDSRLYKSCGGGYAIVALQCMVPKESPQDALYWLQVTILDDQDVGAFVNIRETMQIIDDIPFQNE